jgi:DNA-binding transcriptional regulator PaaX
MLSDCLKQIAESMDVPAEVLMPKADLEHLIREQMNPSLAAPDNWSGWRADTVVAPLRERLKERATS